MPLWRKTRRTPIPFDPSLQTPLLQFGSKDSFTTGDALESIAIFGGTGSGKTSGSANTLATAFLRCGFGGLVMCASSKEADHWRELAAKTGRTQSLIFVDSSAERRFNFLDYAQTTLGRADFQENVVAVFERVAETITGQSTNEGGENAFFQKYAVQLIRASLPFLNTAYGTLRMKDVMRFIDSAPRSAKELESKEWRANSFCAQTMFKAHQNVMPRTSASDDLEVFGAFWTEQFATLAEKTRSNVIATLNNIIGPFLTGYINKLLCTDTNIVPEMTYEGAIIILDLPIVRDGAIAASCQKIFKYLWQKSVLERDVDDHTRPVFLWADECQNFMTKDDFRFVSLSRQFRGGSVYITQDMASYDAEILRQGGTEKEARALLGKFQTMVFHASTDETTCDYASKFIGKIKKYHFTHSITTAQGVNNGGNQDEAGGGSFGGGGNRSESDATGYTEYEDYEVMPTDFQGKLRKGGMKNKKKVDAIILSSNQFEQDGEKSRLKVTFTQS